MSGRGGGGAGEQRRRGEEEEVRRRSNSEELEGEERGGAEAGSLAHSSDKLQHSKGEYLINKLEKQQKACLSPSYYVIPQLLRPKLAVIIAHGFSQTRCNRGCSTITSVH